MVASELKEKVRGAYREAIAEQQPTEISDEELPPSVARVKEQIETRLEAETIGLEFLQELAYIVDSRKKLREAEEDLISTVASVKDAINNLATKLDNLMELKKTNIQLERDVLTKIKSKL